MKEHILDRDLPVEQIIKDLQQVEIPIPSGFPPSRIFTQEFLDANPELFDFLDVESPVYPIPSKLVIAGDSPASLDEYIVEAEDPVQGRARVKIGRTLDQSGRVKVVPKSMSGPSEISKTITSKERTEASKIPIYPKINEREKSRMSDTSEKMRNIMNDFSYNTSAASLQRILDGKIGRSIFGDGTVLGDIGEGIAVAKSFLEDGMGIVNRFLKNPFGLMKKTLGDKGTLIPASGREVLYNDATWISSPVSSVDIPSDAISYISVYNIDSNEEVQRTYKFLLQNVQEVSQESFQLFTTFDTHIPFFYNQKPNIYSYSGELLDVFVLSPVPEDVAAMHGEDQQWKLEMEHDYFNRYRGTSAIENNEIIYITYAGVVRSGYMINYSRGVNANRMSTATFRFDFLVLNEWTYYGTSMSTATESLSEPEKRELEDDIRAQISAAGDSPGSTASESSGEAASGDGQGDYAQSKGDVGDGNSRDSFSA